MKFVLETHTYITKNKEDMLKISTNTMNSNKKVLTVSQNLEPTAGNVSLSQ